MTINSSLDITIRLRSASACSVTEILTVFPECPRVPTYVLFHISSARGPSLVYHLTYPLGDLAYLRYLVHISRVDDTGSHAMNLPRSKTWNVGV
jgi:hypothetical protein